MSIYNENPIVKSGVYHWKCFYTEWGAFKAREKYRERKYNG